MDWIAALNALGMVAQASVLYYVILAYRRLTPRWPWAFMIAGFSMALARRGVMLATDLELSRQWPLPSEMVVTVVTILWAIGMRGISRGVRLQATALLEASDNLRQLRSLLDEPHAP